MIASRLSIIIPSRSPQYLQKTIDDLLAKAEGDVDIIVVLDGIWPDTVPKDNPKVHYLHQGIMHGHYGMRAAINAGVSLATGEYLMKIDEHCMVDQGYDTKLKADCEDNWVVIPRRYRLEPEEWVVVEDGRPPIDYMYLANPFARPHDIEYGLHGSEWKERHYERRDILIDDTMSWQGSCYFMKLSHWNTVIGDMQEDGYGMFTQEAQEIGNKTWFSGGRVVVNKKTWYAHWHKGKKGKGYGFSNQQYKEHQAEKEDGRYYCIDHWMNNRWEQRTRDFEWLIKHFWPVPTWTDTWKADLDAFNKKREAE